MCMVGTIIIVVLWARYCSVGISRWDVVCSIGLRLCVCLRAACAWHIAYSAPYYIMWVTCPPKHIHTRAPRIPPNTAIGPRSGAQQHRTKTGPPPPPPPPPNHANTNDDDDAVVFCAHLAVANARAPRVSIDGMRSTNRMESHIIRLWRGGRGGGLRG